MVEYLPFICKLNTKTTYAKAGYKIEKLGHTVLLETRKQRLAGVPWDLVEGPQRFSRTAQDRKGFISCTWSKFPKRRPKAILTENSKRLQKTKAM